MKSYYYILMDQRYMLKNYALEEILRERANNYRSAEKNIDFWVLIAPKFLSEQHFREKICKSSYNRQFNNNRYYGINSDHEYLRPASYCCLISSNLELIKWIQLRIGYFENFTSFNYPTSKNISIFDGIYGEISRDEFSPLANNKLLLSSKILANKFKNTAEIISLYNI